MMKNAATSDEEKRKQLEAAAAEVEETRKQMPRAKAKVEEEKKRMKTAAAAVDKNKKDLAAASAAVEESKKQLIEDKKRCKIQIEETDESSSEDEEVERKPVAPKTDSQKSKIRLV